MTRAGRTLAGLFLIGLGACSGQRAAGPTAPAHTEPPAEHPSAAEHAEVPEPPSITEVEAARIVVDVRGSRAFAEGHRPGALNLHLEWQQLPARLPAYVPDPATPIAVQAADEGQWEAALVILREQGYVDVVRAGVAGNATLPLLTADQLRKRLEEPDPPIVLDVRTPEEWTGEVIAGAVRIEASEAPSAVADLDPTREYAVICEGGVRSSQLASLLQREGFERVSNVIDGMWAWRKTTGAQR